MVEATKRRGSKKVYAKKCLWKLGSIKMRIVTAIVISSLLSFAAISQSNSISKVWVSDNGNGTYKNPVINADYSDPDAIRVGDDYYMIASSFDAVPGLPILHSNDLVNWKLIGHALKRQPPFGHFEKT